MEIINKTGAGFIFARSMLFGGVAVKPGDRVPAGTDAKKLRMLQTSGRIQLGVFQPQGGAGK